MTTKGRVYKIGDYYFPYIKKWYQFKWVKIDSGFCGAGTAIERIFIQYPNIKNVQVIEINYGGYVDKQKEATTKD